MIKVLTNKQKEALTELKGLSNKELLEALAQVCNKYSIQKGQSYYLSDTNGCAFSTLFYNTDADKSILSFQKVYTCEYQAEKELDHIKLRLIIVNRIRELNKGWRPDFGTEFRNRYIYRSSSTNLLGSSLDSTIQTQPLDMYLKSKELADQLIEEMEEDLIAYFTYKNWDWLEVE